MAEEEKEEKHPKMENFDVYGKTYSHPKLEE